MKRILFFMLAFVICLTSVISPCYASSFPDSLPDINTITDFPYNIDEYILVKNNTSYTLYVMNDYTNVNGTDDIAFRLVWSGSTPEIHLSNGSLDKRQFYISFYQYSATSNSWVKQAGPVDTNFMGMGNQTTSNFVASTFDLQDSSGNIFFTAPPATLEGIIQEEMTKASQEITQTMKIILLCGVGCLALLIALPLFGKVSKIFQMR